MQGTVAMDCHPRPLAQPPAPVSPIGHARHGLDLETLEQRIAATALVDDAELLTFNREHFERVPGLKLASSKS